MHFERFKRSVPPAMSLGERVAREKGIYPDAGTNYDIPFMIFYSNKSQDGYLIADQIPHITGVPGTFLVYWDNRFRGVVNYTFEGWEMDGGHSRELVVALGEWIVIYYQ